MEITTKFIVSVTGWNSKNLVPRCLESIFKQTNKDFTIFWVDDASTDGANILAKKLLEEQQEIPFVFKQNNTHLALVSLNRQWGFLGHKIPDNTIILTVDADDYIAHDKVFCLYRELYDKTGANIIYGQHQYPNGILGGCKEYPENIKQNRDYRTYDWYLSHMRTFKYKLWKNIRKESLLEYCADLPTMFDMAEMVNPNTIIFNPEVTYIYEETQFSASRRIGKEVSMSEARTRLQSKMPILFP
jgi:glycosyltransferase involved in cell wall biosynthesis